MTDAVHKDTSRGWLIFFLVCFALEVFGLGLWAMFFYDANAPVETVTSGGGH